MRLLVVLFLLAVCCLPASVRAVSGDFVTVDFAASAPYTYNHKVGGGAYNDRTIGEYHDVVESLEGRQETCGDLVSYLLAVEIVSNPVDADNALSVNLEFLGDSTGQSGVSLSPFWNCSINGPQPVENGDGGTGSNAGVGGFKTDGFYRDTAPFASITDVSAPTITPFTRANQEVYFTLRGLNAKDRIPVRCDVRLTCKIDSTPTGNLQAALMSATSVVDKKGVGGGAQTVPFKTVSAIQGLTECKPTDGTGPINGTSFNATVVVTSPTMINGGSFSSNFYYSWPAGAFLVTSVSSGIKNLNTYDTYCTYQHRGEYLYHQGTCGCESVFINNTQPQLFYASNGGYYNPTPTQETLRGIPCLVYTSLGTGQTITKLYLEASTQKPVRAIFTDGTIFDFTNVVFGYVAPSIFSIPIVPCTCKRRLDIAVFLDKSSSVSSDLFLAEKAFATNFVGDFTVGTSASQFSINTYDSVVTNTLALSQGTTATNVLNAVAGLSCKTSGNTKTCSTAAPDIANAINTGVAQLQASSRSNVATPIILIVASTWDTTTNLAIQAATVKANTAGIKVFAVVYTTTMGTSSNYLVANVPYYLTVRYSMAELSGVDPEDISTKVCKENTKPCGASCCGVCDPTCGTCIPVDTCLVTPNCVNQTTVVSSCCVTSPISDPCPFTVPAGSCNVSNCNTNTGKCESINNCLPPANDKCYDYACVSGSCKTTFKQQSTNCATISCVNNALVSTPVDCGKSNFCFNFTCDEQKGCQTITIPDPQPSNDKCIKRSCDPATGWTSTNVVCTSSDPCFPSTCIDGVCVISSKLDSCKKQNDLCDRTTCSGGVCVPNYRNCSLEAVPNCNELDTSTYPTGCDPITGNCIYTKKICRATDCNDTTCSTVSGQCVTLPTAGCGTIQGCNCVSTACVKSRCNPTSLQCIEENVNCSLQVPDNCTVATSCDSSTGCVFSPIDCSSQVPSSKCATFVRDPNYLGCCREVSKACTGSNPCLQYSCDDTTGNCTTKEKCSPSANKCETVSCNLLGSCVKDYKVCTPPNGCYNATCDSSSGNCVFQEICDDDNLCTEDSCLNGACHYQAIDCDDKNLCTENHCLEGACASRTIVCNDNNNCTVDTCVPAIGCVYTPDNSSCFSPDPCVSSYCDIQKGCVMSSVSCPPTGSFCLNSACVPFVGCVNESYVCNRSMVANLSHAVTCVVVSCNEKKARCTADILVCGDNVETAVIVAAALGTGVVVGIVVAVLAVFFGACGGTAYAIYQSSQATDHATISSNPLYIEKGTSGTNPLHRPSAAF